MGIDLFQSKNLEEINVIKNIREEEEEEQSKSSNADGAA